jgi:hypothetical protein
MVIRFRGPKEFRVVPHKPDFDRLAFGTILAQDSPHLDRDQTRHAKQLEKLLCDEARATPPLPSAPYLPTYLPALSCLHQFRRPTPSASTAVCGRAGLLGQCNQPSLLSLA